MTITLGIILTVAIPIIGDIIYVYILYRKRFKTIKLCDVVKFPLKEDSEKIYTEELQRMIRKTNGWLYILIFYTTIYITVGVWAIVFPLFCFFSTSEALMISICSVIATVASSIMMFLTPKEQAQIGGRAWKDSSSYMSDFNIQLPLFETEQEFCVQLSLLQLQLTNVSKSTKI